MFQFRKPKQYCVAYNWNGVTEGECVYAETASKAKGKVYRDCEFFHDIGLSFMEFAKLITSVRLVDRAVPYTWANKHYGTNIKVGQVMFNTTINELVQITSYNSSKGNYIMFINIEGKELFDHPLNFKEDISEHSEKYNLYDTKHGCFWRSNSQGYTNKQEQAGLYSIQEIMSFDSSLSCRHLQPRKAV